jgi:tRNA(Arg) A34 adenosine deaminase TadA
MKTKIGNDNWIRAALIAAENSEGGPFGAVVVRNLEVIASGCNLVVPTDDPTAHAEIVAIRRACKVLGTHRLTDCELYTTCEPCPMCLSAAYWARIKRIFYCVDRESAAAIGFADQFIYDELSRENNQRKVQAVQVSRLYGFRAERIMRDWKGQLY